MKELFFDFLAGLGLFAVGAVLFLAVIYGGAWVDHMAPETGEAIFNVARWAGLIIWSSGTCVAMGAWMRGKW